MYTTAWLTSLRKEEATGVDHHEPVCHAARLTDHVHKHLAARSVGDDPSAFVSQAVEAIDHVGRLQVAVGCTDTEVKATRAAILGKKNTEEPYNPKGPSSVTVSNTPTPGGNSKK